MPVPPVDGGATVLYNHAIGLISLGHNLKVLAINSSRNYIEPERIPKQFVSDTNLETIYIDTRINILKAFLNIFGSSSYNVDRFISAEFENRLKAILAKQPFDIVQLETIFLGPYIHVIRKYSNAKIILRSQNAEYKIWERLALNCGQPLKKWYYQLLSKRLKNYELNAMNNTDAVIAITDIDREIFLREGLRVPVISIPLGFDFSLVRDVEQKNNSDASIYHLAAMNWKPNIEAVTWFLNKVWQNVHKALPKLKFYLAGNNMPERFLKNNLKNVFVRGRIDNPIQYIADKQIMVVPLLSGSGIRAKIVEAMSRGKTVISTTVGAEGINYTDGENILIANSPDEFVIQIKKCVEDQSFATNVGKQAKALMLEGHDNIKCVQKCVEFYRLINSQL